MILESYNEKIPVFEKMQEVAEKALKSSLSDNSIVITALESRIKTEKSLAGKLELKGSKYDSIGDMTDIVGLRVITFFTDDVDKISAIAEKIFEVDWKNSVDKRRTHELSDFGYLSLHYICRIPVSLFHDPAMPEVNEFRFELQMRTALQHVWATMDHDTGYKSGVEIPKEYLRSLNRLAGILELADDEFSRIRRGINNYRREVEALVANGKFESVRLDGDTYRSYLKLRPYDEMNNRIAAINQAEIHETSLMPFLKVFSKFGFTTLQDVENLRKDYQDDAYHLAVYQIGNTDLDIISSSITLQNLCTVYILRNGGGRMGLERFFNFLFGKSDYNKKRAERVYEQAFQLQMIRK